MVVALLRGRAELRLAGAELWAGVADVLADGDFLVDADLLAAADLLAGACLLAGADVAPPAVVADRGPRSNDSATDSSTRPTVAAADLRLSAACRRAMASPSRSFIPPP